MDEMSQDYELQASFVARYEYLHRELQQQQQHWSHSRDEASGYDVNNTSSLTSLPTDEYTAWFEWSAVNCNESSQHSSSTHFVLIHVCCL